MLKINELKYLFSRFLPSDSATLKTYKEAFKGTSYVPTAYSYFLLETQFFSQSGYFLYFLILISDWQDSLPGVLDIVHKLMIVTNFFNLLR